MGLPVVQFLQGNLEWQELTKPKLDHNWKTSKPDTLTSGFTNSPEFSEAYRFKLLKKAWWIKENLSWSYNSVMNERELKNPNPPGSALFPSRRLLLKKYQIIYIYSYKGLSTCRWGTSGRWGTPVGWGTPAGWGTPPGRDRSHLYLRRSLRGRKH